MKKIYYWLIAALVILLLFGGYFIYKDQKIKAIKEKEHEEYIANLLNSNIIYDGISFEGMDLSGMSYSDAELLIENKKQERLSQKFYLKFPSFSEGYPFVDLGYNLDANDAIKSIRSFAKEGTKEERIEEIEDLRKNGVNYSFYKSLDEDKLRTFVDSLDIKLGDEPVEPRLEFTDTGFNIIDGKDGVVLNKEKLYQDLKSALIGDKNELVVEGEITSPKISNELLHRINGRIGIYSTDMGLGTKGRNENIKLSCSLINNLVVMPGEEISFNEKMGDITAQNGYKMASTIVGGKYVDSLGGGICQTSTTLYNALVRSDTTVIERHPHTIAAPYVPVGEDGAVWVGSKDLKFRNDWDFPILIKAYIDTNHIIVEIYGDKNIKDYSVIMQSEITETIPATTYEEEDPELEAGKKEVVRKARNGMRAQSYKVYKKDGQVIKTVPYWKSYYPKQDGLVKVGTKPTENGGENPAEVPNEEAPTEEITTIDLFSE